MANLEELVVSLVAETSGLRSELQKATTATKDATNKMDKALEEFTTNSSKNLSFFETAMATMTGFLAAEAVQAVLGFAKDALGVLKDALIEGAGAAIAEETALKRLANSLALSGQYSNEAMKELQSFSSQMEELTGVQDDVVASNLALLSSLTKLDAEGLQRAQKAALDMSVALGMDLDSATRLVGKGIEGNVEAFKRYGITIQEGATKAETLNNVLTKLQSSFGGAAEGAAQTFGGAVKNLSNAWGNLAESLASTVTKNPAVVAMLNVLTDALKSLTSDADGSAIALREGLAKGFIFVAQSIGVMAEIGDTVFRGLLAAVQGLVIGLNAVAGSFAWIADKLGIIKDEDPFSRLKESAAALDKNLNNESALGKVGTLMADMSYAGEAAFSKIKTSSDAASASIKNQTVALEELSGKQRELYQNFAQGLADEGAALDAKYQYENDLRSLNMEMELAQIEDHNATKFTIMEENLAAQQELLAANQEQEWANLQTAYANKLITDQQYNDAKTALSRKQFLETKQLEVDKTKLEAAEQKQREANLASTLGTIATLSQSSSKELAAIGKAAAIAQATIDGFAAVQKALASAPPPFNFALAALVGVATAANVAKIAGVGLNEGGTIAGGGANIDTVPASLTKGETVVTRDLTDKMNEFFSNPQSGAGGNVTVVLELRDGLVEFIEAKILERQATGVSLLGPGVV